MRRTSCALALLPLALAPAAPAAAGPEEPAATLTWQSTATTREAVTRDLERLYLSLYNTGNLALRELPNPDGRYVEPLVREAGIWHGAYFPQTIDSLLCDLNRTVCHRPLRAASGKELADVTGHVGGYLPSRPVWTFDPGVVLQVPAYEFETATRLKKTAVPRGWTPDAYEAPDSLDCSAWDMTCGELVRRLNPDLIGSKRGGDSAALPVQSLTTEIPLRQDAQSAYGKVLDELGAAQPRDETLFAVPATAGFESGWRGQLDTASPNDLTIQSLEPNLLSIGHGAKFGVRNEPLFGEQADLMALIAHPFSQLDELPPPYNRPVDILVLDGAFDGSHCDLPGGIEAPGCPTVDSSPPHPFDDHAAHVVGLISAPVNGHGIVGLNPAAKVIYQRIEKSFTAQEIQDIQFKLMTAALQSVRVANASWGFDRQIGGGDLRDGIAALDSTLLLVAAAGNEKAEMDDDCRVFPACLYDLDNVITVVGIDRDPDDPHLWEQQDGGSNSSRNFHVAAVAENVLSTVSGNRLGRMSGTSMAAPQVSAAASIIYSAAELIYPDLLDQSKRLAPKVVKDRLIYTSDLFPGLETRVMSGRLNVSRAIDIVDSVVVVRENGGTRTLTGRIVQNPADVVTCLNPAGEDFQHAWAAIRRMVHVPLRDRYVIFKHVEGGHDDRVKRDVELVRVNGCNLNSLNHLGRMVLRDGSEVEFRLGDVVDYTSTLLE